ncbi:hypothetical protein CRE_03090 [Caenorhabditis remanei]|uniref:Skp1-related protein n=1 Tax=Caenorhabditis remanei TaxID=31234 RepID=E3LWH9_CAERE|nr:hypothetical protein CRE_03090 [Caenorhabditis remanei]
MSAEEAPVDVPAPEAAPVESLVYITLISDDQKEVNISSEALKQSQTLADMVANLQSSGVTEVKRLGPLRNITGDSLVKIVEWCEHHKGEPILVHNDVGAAPNAGPNRAAIPEWDEEFLKVNNGELYKLIQVSEILEIKRLEKYACQTVAQMADGMSPEEMQNFFGIPGDEEDDETAGPSN